MGKNDFKTIRVMKRLFILLISIITTGSCLATNRALLVGIGKYPTTETGWKEIHGDADVYLLKPLLAEQGFTDIRTLVNEAATKKAIITALNDLIASTTAGDKIYIHFSGHGQPVEDANGDETDEDFPFDQSFVAYDAYRSTQKNKYFGENHLIDDELTPLLDRLKTKVGKQGQIFMAVDACYSRGMERGQDSDLAEISCKREQNRRACPSVMPSAAEIIQIEDPDILNSARGCGTDDAFTASSYLKNLPKPQPFSKGTGTLTVVSACKADERNFEYKTDGQLYGSLSFYLSTLLKRGADFSSWTRSFESGAFKSTKIFPWQTPTIEIYR